MKSQHPCRKLPHGNSRKGKQAKATAPKPTAPNVVEPPSKNRLLAGYLAHEFLTRGTLLGRKIELESAGTGLGGSSSAEPKRSQVSSQAVEVKEHGSYEEVATLLKTKGTHIKGIVNPAQLSNWIKE